MRTDGEIQRDVVEELAWDTRVGQTSVGVEVEAGIVTLTGTVGAYANKLAAQEGAHRVSGVLDVANDIRVHRPDGLFRTDTEIAAAVRQVLDWNAMVPSERVRSSISDGWVTLEGVVDNNHQRVAIERAVSHISGVSGVINHMTVSTATIEPIAIRRAIERALSRRGARDFGAVEIAVEDHTLTLRGRLSHELEKLAVLETVAHAPGVRAIKDQIELANRH